MVAPIRALVLAGKGINCDAETALAFRLAGARADRVHIVDLVRRPRGLDRCQILALPGGFSYGDDLGAGMALANKIRTDLAGELRRFIRAGKLIIGICNGFQVLVKLGLLPAVTGTLFRQDATLTLNASGKFEDRWVNLRVPPNSVCAFLRGMDTLYLPIRHGEGRFLMGKTNRSALARNGQIALQYTGDSGSPTMEYPANPNGSQDAIAGVTDPTGRIFGLMPHPEAFLTFFHHPRWTRIASERRRRGLPVPRDGEGLSIFRNAVARAREDA